MQEWMKVNAVQLVIGLVVIIAGYQLMEFRLGNVEKVALDVPINKTKITTLNAEINSMQREQDHNYNRMDKFAEVLVENTARVGTLESGVSATSAIILRMEDILDRLDKTLGTMRVEDGVQNSRLDHLEKAN